MKEASTDASRSDAGARRLPRRRNLRRSDPLLRPRVLLSSSRQRLRKTPMRRTQRRWLAPQRRLQQLLQPRLHDKIPEDGSVAAAERSIPRRRKIALDQTARGR